MDQRYVLISPCRNEAQYMRETLDTVIGQSGSMMMVAVSGTAVSLV